MSEKRKFDSIQSKSSSNENSNDFNSEREAKKPNSRIPCMFGSKCTKGDLCPFFHEKPKLLTAEEKKKIHIKNRLHGDLIEKCKELWNELRSKEIEDVERIDLMEKLMVLTTGKIAEIALKHDSSRVIQCMVKYSNPEQKKTIYKELTPHFLECSQSKHGSFLAISLIRHASKEQFADLIAQLKGNLYSLSLHQISSKVIEYIFDQKMTDTQGKIFVEEIFSKEYMNFPQSTIYHIADLCKDNVSKLKTIKDRLRPWIEKIKDKGLSDHVYFHYIFSEYLKNATPAEIHYMTTIFIEFYPALLVTEDGSYCVLKMISYSTAKDKKATVKVFKDQVINLINHPFSYRAILTLLSTIDDTKLLQKTLLAEILKGIDLIVLSPYGCTILLQLLSPNNEKYITKTVTEFLQITYLPQEGENGKIEQVATSKKDPELRRTEILGVIEPTIISTLLTKMPDLFNQSASTNLVYEMIIRNWNNQLITAVCSLVNDTPSLIENQAGKLYYKLLKKLKEVEKPEIVQQLYNSIKTTLSKLEKTDKLKKIITLFTELKVEH